MEEQDILKKIGKNYKLIWGIIGILSFVFVGGYNLSIRLYELKDLPLTVKNIKEEIRPYKSLPAKMEILEGKQSSLELQIAKGFSKLEAKLDQVQMTQNIINTQIVKSGLEHTK